MELLLLGTNVFIYFDKQIFLHTLCRWDTLKYNISFTNNVKFLLMITSASEMVQNKKAKGIPGFH